MARKSRDEQIKELDAKARTIDAKQRALRTEKAIVASPLLSEIRRAVKILDREHERMTDGDVTATDGEHPELLEAVGCALDSINAYFATLGQPQNGAPKP